MELRFYVKGALPFFAYKVIVTCFVHGTESGVVAEPFWVESASSSEEVVAIVPLGCQLRHSYRFLIEVLVRRP